MARERSLEAVMFSFQVLTKSAVDSHFQWKYGSLKLLGRSDVCLKERIGFRFSYDWWAVRRCVNSWITRRSVTFLLSPKEPTSGLGIILDSVCGMFPHLLSPLLQLLRALVSGKSTAKKVGGLVRCLNSECGRYFWGCHCHSKN